MAPRFGIDFTSDISERLKTWEEQYVSEASFAKYQRACAWVMDETAKQVAVTLRNVAPQFIQKPTPWTLRGFQYRRSLGKGRDVNSGVYSEFYIMDDQSVVLKYLLGMQPNVRMPGDVGLAQDRIYLPAWDNLARTQGIRPNAYGNLPGGVMARLNREANNDRNKRRRSPNSSGVFKREVTINGVQGIAYVNRPAREVTNEPKLIPIPGQHRMKEVRRVKNLDRPRVLMYSIPKATYDPSFQRAWDNAVNEAVDMIPDRMSSELAENLRHMASRR